MPPILLAQLPQIPVSRQPMEIVEPKGLGHPDSLCDAMMEAISVALSHAYLEIAGHMLHDDLDKGLLVIGQTTPALGGGRVEAPMRRIVGDRATTVMSHLPSRGFSKESWQRYQPSSRSWCVALSPSGNLPHAPTGSVVPPHRSHTGCSCCTSKECLQLTLLRRMHDGEDFVTWLQDQISAWEQQLATADDGRQRALGW
jgi:hypothetical protein